MNHDPQELVRRFNDDEDVWRCFQEKCKWRRRANLSPELKKRLDELEWIAAEREARPVRAIGKWIDP